MLAQLNAPQEILATGNSGAGKELLIALRPVQITLELIDATHSGATAIAHSALDQDCGRTIRIGLCHKHLLCHRSLARADTANIRFFVGLSLVEYCFWWAETTDGRGVLQALREAAGYRPEENAWGSGFASRLAICELMHTVDELPIFGTSPRSGPHTLGTINIVSRSPSDIINWRTRSFAPEPGEPIPKRKSAKVASKPTPVPAIPVAGPSFSERFLGCAEEMLDPETYAALKDLTTERTHAKN